GRRPGIPWGKRSGRRATTSRGQKQSGSASPCRRRSPRAFSSGWHLTCPGRLRRSAPACPLRPPRSPRVGPPFPRVPRPARVPTAGAVPLVSWAVGGSQLARDAAQTNDEVYRDAIATCMAPARLAAEFGPQDARVATSLELLADCYGSQHRYVLAEPLRREAI